MKRAILITLIGVLILLTSTTIALAKGSVDKITISGPGLAKPVEITDPLTLRQFSPWAKIIYDLQKGALAEAPVTDQIYEVLVYIKDEKAQLQVRYAFKYVPGQPGYVYIPGKGDPWYETNISTISLGSTIEGRWFFASQEWSTAVQPLLGEESLLATTSPLPSNSIKLSTGVEWLGLGLVAIMAGALIWFYSRRQGKVP